MRIAIISDVHANLQAWQAVLRDLQRQSPDMTLCLGDTVGYGPDPQAVLDGVREVCSGSVLGDHEALIVGHLPRDPYDDESLRLIDWTARQLDEDAIAYLSEIPYKLGDDDMLCVHADPVEPSDFARIDNKKSASIAMKAFRQTIAFSGHTHVAGLFEQTADGSARWQHPSDCQLKPETKYLINPGSVGDPLDASPRASYCIFDAETLELQFRRIPFAFENYRLAIEAAGTKIAPRCLAFINNKLTADGKGDSPAGPAQSHEQPTGLLALK